VSVAKSGFADYFLVFCVIRAMKIVVQTSINVKQSWEFHKSVTDLHGGTHVRLALPEERLDCVPISDVKLNLNCRDEMIPILRSLQHLYDDDLRRREILDLVGRDVNKGTSRKHGRRGMNYWEITVLQSVRLGCNLDYDKTQDLAENHRRLRQMMGIGDWQDNIDFDWRCIQDNLIKLRPETVKKIGDLVVKSGHQIDAQAIKSVRGDTFVVETNIHYPTESTLIGDGLRKIVTLAAELAADYGKDGWRQHAYLLKKMRKLVRAIGRVSRGKNQRLEQLKRKYKELLSLSESLMTKACQLLKSLDYAAVNEAVTLAELKNGKVPETPKGLLLYYVRLTRVVCRNARRRVLHGEKVANDEKLFSMFEPHTELINRGKQPNPIEFGHKVLVVEDAAGFIVTHQVVDAGVLDQDLVIPVMTELQDRFDGKIEKASFDRGFHTPETQKQLAELVGTPCIASKGVNKGRQQYKEGTVEFRQARQNHPGVESAIGALQSGNGQKRCRDRGNVGYVRYVALGMLGRNLHTLGKLLLAQDDADCQAAKSKRKRAGAKPKLKRVG